MTSPDHRALPDGPRLSASDISFRWLAHPYEFLDECAAAHGDTFTLRFTRFGTHVVVAHPDDVRAVLTAEPDVLSAGQGNALLEPILGKHSMLLVDGDRHLAQRAVLQPAFRGDQMPTYARVVTEATRRWTRPWAAGGAVNIHRTAVEISKEVILRAVLGLTGTDLDRVSRLVHDLMVLVGTNATFDEGCNDRRFLHRFRRARTSLGEALQEHVERHRCSGAARDGDVLSLLVTARSESGDHLADEEIRDQLITMVLAGHETTASSITWALLCLHDEPDVLQRLLRQLDDLGRELSDERLAELPYLQAVSLETLRVRPVVPVISRRVQRPFRLGDRTLPAGVFVTPCAYLAHRRADVFASPTAFRPGRGDRLEFLAPARVDRRRCAPRRARHCRPLSVDGDDCRPRNPGANLERQDQAPCMRRRPPPRNPGDSPGSFGCAGIPSCAARRRARTWSASRPARPCRSTRARRAQRSPRFAPVTD